MRTTIKWVLLTVLPTVALIGSAILTVRALRPPRNPSPPAIETPILRIVDEDGHCVGQLQGQHGGLVLIVHLPDSTASMAFRPRAGAMHLEMSRRMADAFQAFAADPDVRSVAMP